MSDAEDEAKLIYLAATQALGRREYSRAELAQRLQRKGFDATLIEPILAELQARDWLNDERFAESFVRVHVGKGQGPLRIRHALQQYGIDAETCALALEAYADEWNTLAAEVRCKRFGEAAPKDAKERARQSRFLNYRGFSGEHIRYALEPIRR